MDDWAPFVTGRDELVRAFATVVAAGVTRADTDHPAFHGCYDWHSAVHGTYALLAASRLTGDSTFADAALSQTGPAAGSTTRCRTAWPGHLSSTPRQCGPLSTCSAIWPPPRPTGS